MVKNKKHKKSIKTKQSLRPAKLAKAAPEVKAKPKEEGVHRVKIRVIGIGGGGGTIVSEIAAVVPRADFWVANTDVQALKRVGRRCHTLAFGQELTKGLGSGADVKIGQLAAKQAAEKISKLFNGIDLCILVSCLGGGTGSGAAPVFAQLAREANCLTLGIFTLPFRFEGERKMITARQSLAKMLPELSASVIFPNEKIFKLIDPKTGFQQSLSAVNSMLASDLKNLIEIIYLPGMINIDFADLKTILGERGQAAYLASATVDTENRSEMVCKQLLSHPLNDYDPRGAKNILFNISSGQSISIDEVNYIAKQVFDLNPQARIVFGVSQKPNADKAVTVTLLAVGSVHRETQKKKWRKKQSKPEPKLKKDKDEQSTPGKTRQDEVVSAAPKKKTKKSKTKKVALKHKAKGAVKQGVFEKRGAKKGRLPKKRAEKIKKEAEKKPAKVSSAVPRRKSALDIRREMETVEQEQVAQERRWDIPAFLRRQT